MATITDTEIKKRGLGALLNELGEVDAERFITLLNRDPFDYTIWQRDILEEMNIFQISSKAMAMHNKKTDQ